MRRYAEGTTVPVEVSQAEIRTLLARHGCKHFATAEEPERSAIQFVLDGLPYRFTIERPSAAGIRADYDANRRRGQPYWIDAEKKAEAEWRRRWRARLLWLKATLEFAAGEGPEEVAAALMAHLVLPGGATMQRWAAQQLPGAYAAGRMPPLHAWVERRPHERAVYMVWEPTPAEREQIAAGGDLKLGIWFMEPIPPVSLEVVLEEKVVDHDPGHRIAAESTAHECDCPGPKAGYHFAHRASCPRREAEGFA